MIDEQRKEFCRIFFLLHLAPFGDRKPMTERRGALLQKVLDDMRDRAFAHYTTGEFIRRGLKLRPLPPRPRRMTAEWLGWREYDAFDPGHLWNGWACPLMTRTQLEILLPDHNSASGVASEDPHLELRADSALAVKCGDEETEIRADDRGLDEPAYDIGSLGLCWEWVEEDAERCMCGSSEFTTLKLLVSAARVCVRCGKEKTWPRQVISEPSC